MRSMFEVFAFLRTTVGKKYLMALTGLAICLFVLVHMTGNMLLFLGPKMYNSYSHALISNPLIYIAELGLVLIFGTHVYLSISLTYGNWRARPQGYVRGTNGEKGISIISKTMIYQGSLLFAFLVYHLITFKYGPYYEVIYDGKTMRDIHRLMVEVFHDPWYVWGYVVCMVAIGIHLSHAFSASFQSLGMYHPRLSPWLEKLGIVYLLVVAGGFISQPIYIYFFN
jgi:succinate dehydrogenase / fumarate reductase, cytochrome b subunit